MWLWSRLDWCFAADFKIKAGNSPGHVAMCILGSRRSLRTPFRCNWIESIVGWSLVPFLGCIVTLSLSHWYPVVR